MQIIPIASGKGGVGKTILAASLGYLLAKKGKTVLMVDLDLGASNLHSCIGIPNTNPGINAFINGEEQQLENLIVATDFPRLYLIPGDQMVPGSANLPYYLKMRLLRELERQVADYIILDLGAGSSFNTVDFFLSSPAGIIVSSAEPTAILNAYVFVKTACYRLLLRSFPRKSPERHLIREYLSNRIEGSHLSFAGLIRELGGISRESEALAQTQLQSFYARVIINMGRSESDLRLGARLREVCVKNVGVALEYLGFVPYETETYKSILVKKPMPDFFPDSPFAHSASRIADGIIRDGRGGLRKLHEADEDIEMLRQIYREEGAGVQRI